MSPEVTAAWIAVGGVVLTVIATVVVQIFGRRATNQDTQRTLKEQREQLDKTLEAQGKQLDKTLEEQRNQLGRTLDAQRLQTLNERFATAAGQLGDDRPPAVRLAGVYAMAGLAEDWPENQQTCVDVLCAYLRLPYNPDPRKGVDPEPRKGDNPEPRKGVDPDLLSAYRANRVVRHTVIRLIGAHLRAGAAASWQGLNFDFTGVVFDGGDFSGAMFSRGTIRFTGAEFSGGRVDFRGARFSDSTVDFGGAVFSGGEVSFYGAVFSGSTVLFSLAKFSGGTVRFDMVGFLSGSTVLFTDARFLPAGKVSFGGARFSDGQVRFDLAKFAGGTVDFSDAKFVGGTVDFSDAHNWAVAPTFSWKGAPPPGVKLPKEARS